MTFAFKPQVTIDLDGPHGNVFAVIGICCIVARQVGMPSREIDEFRREILSTHSYTEALRVMGEWFELRRGDRP